MGVQDKDKQLAPGLTGETAGADEVPAGLFADLLAELETPADAASGNKGKAALLNCTAALETIGHLRGEIESKWGSPELDVFISQLFVDSRQGARKGLPADVADELVFLERLNKMVRALDAATQLKLSVAEAYRLVDQGDQSRLEAVQQPGVQLGEVVFAARQLAPVDGFAVRLGRSLLALVRTRAFVYFVVAGGATIFLWPRISRFLSYFLN
jgi:hypothetical protein